MIFNQNIIKGYYPINYQIITGSSVDDIYDEELGDHWAFVIAVLDKEKENPNFFTVNFDRDRELSLLFRQSYQDYLNSGCPYCYLEFIQDWLQAYQKEISKEAK